ncbi:MAG TPA: hypothetical protein VMP03_04585, partial [Methylomirabilota bacterium]|nr:hypothetical protein [Methylomirabilota bacterium]
RLLEKVEQDQIVFDRSTEDAVDLAIVGGFDMTLQYYFHGFGGVMTAYRDVDRASHEELLRRIGRTLRPIDPDAPEGGK